MKLIKDLGNNQFIVEINDGQKGKYRDNGISIAHDYIAFKGWDTLQNINGGMTDISFKVTVQIPIRSCIQVIIPKILESDYSKLEHIKDRPVCTDDEYYRNYNLDKPRWKKGDLLPTYTYSNECVHYYNTSKKEYMVAIKEKGEREFSHVTLSFFNKFIKDNLTY